MKKLLHICTMFAIAFTISSCGTNYNTANRYPPDGVYRAPDGNVYRQGQIYRDRSGNVYQNGQILRRGDVVGVPGIILADGKLAPGQAKKIYGGEATDYAPGQQKKVFKKNKNKYKK